MNKAAKTRLRKSWEVKRGEAIIAPPGAVVNGCRQLAVIGWDARRFCLRTRGPVEGSSRSLEKPGGKGTSKAKRGRFSAQQPNLRGTSTEDYWLLADSRRRVVPLRMCVRTPPWHLSGLSGFLAFGCRVERLHNFFSFFKAATDHFRKESPSFILFSARETATISSIFIILSINPRPVIGYL